MGRAVMIPSRMTDYAATAGAFRWTVPERFTFARELRAHAKRVTAPYRYPRRIEFVAELPKTPSGKLRRRLLRDREFARGG